MVFTECRYEPPPGRDELGNIITVPTGGSNTKSSDSSTSPAGSGDAGKITSSTTAVKHDHPSQARHPETDGGQMHYLVI